MRLHGLHIKKYVWILMIIGLVACQRTVPSLIEDDPRLPHEMAGSSDTQIYLLQRKFLKYHIKVISIGEQYLISIPANAVFADQSPRILWSSYGVLNDVACFIRQYRTVSVNVSGYVSPYSSTRRQHALAKARAENVARYLWSQGLDTRLMTAIGQGSQKPVVRRNLPRDDQANARIEITFKRVDA